MPTVAIKHSCNPHTYQDKKHPGKRVFTTARKNSPPSYRCTVCGKEQSI